MLDSFKPDWVSSPGDTIRDILNERKLDVSQFASLVKEPRDRAALLLDGSLAISIQMAETLASALGGSPEFWFSRDHLYREEARRIEAEEQAWVDEMPVRDMEKFGWIPRPPRPPLRDVLLHFFGVPSVPAWRRHYASVASQAAFRTSQTLDSNACAVAAWLRRGQIEASQLGLSAWDPQQFRESIPELRSHARTKDPAVFLPELQRICAKAGVGLCVVRTPDGCRASGATRLTPDGHALLMMSFRHLSDDHFWFTLFHEAGHLLLHADLVPVLEGLDSNTDAMEQEANEFAESVLLPGELSSALGRIKRDERSILSFARKTGLSSGIVVGQMQHRKLIPRNHFNGLKRFYEWT